MKIIGNYASKNNVPFTGEFQLKRIDGINCAYCACPTLSRRTINDTFSPFYSSRMALDRAKDMRSYLRPFQRAVLDYFLNIRKRYDLKSDFQVFDKAKTLSSTVVREDLTEKFNAIKEIINGSLYEGLKSKINTDENILEDFILRRRRYPDLHNFVFLERGLGIKKWDKSIPARKIKAIVQGMDKAEYSVQGYVLDKIRTLSVEDVFKDLFLESEATIEHVKPRSQHGADNISNYLLVCRRCNSERKSQDLAKYYKQHPSIKKNIDDQLEALSKQIPKLISDNKLSKEYEDYTYQARNNVAAMSGEQLGYHEIMLHL